MQTHFSDFFFNFRNYCVSIDKRLFNNIKINVIYHVFFSKYVFWKKKVFLPESFYVTLHNPKECWWHPIFRIATQFSESENFGPLGSGGGGALHCKMSDR